MLSMVNLVLIGHLLPNQRTTILQTHQNIKLKKCILPNQNSKSQFLIQGGKKQRPMTLFTCSDLETPQTKKSALKKFGYSAGGLRMIGTFTRVEESSQHAYSGMRLNVSNVLSSTSVYHLSRPKDDNNRGRVQFIH